MITKHLSEEEIQQYALDSSACEAATGDHVRVCEDCKEKVAGYRLLVTGIRQQPQPSFDFNLSEAVLSKLPLSARKREVKELNPVYWLVLSGIVLVGATIYLFRRYAPGMFENIIPLLIYLIVPTVIIMLAILIIDMNRNYQKKMSSLDFY